MPHGFSVDGGGIFHIMHSTAPRVSGLKRSVIPCRSFMLLEMFAQRIRINQSHNHTPRSSKITGTAFLNSMSIMFAICLI